MGARKEAKTKQSGPAEGLGKLAGRKDMSAGIVFAASIVVFSLGGYFLDAELGTSPLCLLLGLALGGVGGFIHLVESVSPGTLFSSRRKDAAAGPDRRDADGSAAEDQDSEQ